MTSPRTLTLFALGLALGHAAPTRADDPGAANAKQLAGLFMQSCLRFAGDQDGLRAWAKQMGLPELPAKPRQRFLAGLPGTVFDASNTAGKFVLLSQDGGACSALAESASGPAVLSNLEQDMHDAQISFKITSERTDTEEKSLRHREYTASANRRAWQLLVSIVQDPPGGQAMLTANPR